MAENKSASEEAQCPPCAGTALWGLSWALACCLHGLLLQSVNQERKSAVYDCTDIKTNILVLRIKKSIFLTQKFIFFPSDLKRNGSTSADPYKYHGPWALCLLMKCQPWLLVALRAHLGGSSVFLPKGKLNLRNSGNSELHSSGAVGAETEQTQML